MKRLVLEKPKDPLRFLIKTITENPFTPPPPAEEGVENENVPAGYVASTAADPAIPVVEES